MEKETKVIRIGGLFDKKGKTHQAGSVYAARVIAPNIDTCARGYREPLVISYEH